MIQRLESLGVDVYTPKPEGAQSEGDIWDQIAGYDDIKQVCLTCVFYAGYQGHDHSLHQISREIPGNRQKNTKKLHLSSSTLSTLRRTSRHWKNIDCQNHRSGEQYYFGVGDLEGNLVRHIPLESVVNKYYGESEKRLNAILKLCNEIDNCIIFIDEV